MSDSRSNGARTLRPAETTTFEHTITGLLAKRRDMLTEAELIRDRLAEIKNDLSALDRTLGTLGFKGDPVLWRKRH